MLLLDVKLDLAAEVVNRLQALPHADVEKPLDRGRSQEPLDHPLALLGDLRLLFEAAQHLERWSDPHPSVVCVQIGSEHALEGDVDSRLDAERHQVFVIFTYHLLAAYVGVVGKFLDDPVEVGGHHVDPRKLSLPENRDELIQLFLFNLLENVVLNVQKDVQFHPFNLVLADGLDLPLSVVSADLVEVLGSLELLFVKLLLLP